MSCTHKPEVARICAHVEDDTYLEAFTGRGVEYDLVCRACADSGDRTTLSGICADCVASLGGAVGRVGDPEILIDDRLQITYEEREVSFNGIDLQIVPVTGACRDHWLGLEGNGRIFEVLDGTTTELARVDITTPYGQPLAYTLHASRGARFAAVVETKGVRGFIVELATGRTVPLVREDYHAEHCTFPFAFVERDGRVLYIWAPTWNRLDLVDAETGENLSARTFTHRDEATPDDPAHYLDYFHCGLRVSPNARRFADNGWVWHPLGMVTTASIDAWLANPFETEDGPTYKQLEWRDYWDGPIAWLDDDHIIMWGRGQDREPIDAAEIHSAVTGKRVHWFAGPTWGRFFVDNRHLVIAATFANDSNNYIEVWDLDRGHQLADFVHNRINLCAFHPDAKLLASNVLGGTMAISHIISREAIADERVAAIKARRDVADLPILGDLLEQLGLADDRLIAHCRESHTGDTCWVFDRI
ncbi:MAG: hypothetical protein QM831_24540 [Kofleriaceae bacterium]